MVVRCFETPCGTLVLGACGGRLYMCDWKIKGRHIPLPESCGDVDDETVQSGIIDKAVSQLEEYFRGVRRQFDVSLQLTGTEFQQKVWRLLLEIPYGETLSYGEVARQAGCPRGVRAVANAIGSNRLSVFVPCHRVVGSDGSMTGYAGGIEAKRMMLRIEENHRNI